MLSDAKDGDNVVFVSSFVPWGATPQEAIAAVTDYSPELAVQRKAGFADAFVGGGADVHERLRSLVVEATAEENLQAMPAAWQAWL